MSEKTVITCDHCGKEIHNNCDERFSHMGCNAAFAMGTIDACSREHLGLALAKAFGLPIDTKAADLFVEHAKSEARRVFLEAEVKRLGAQIGEIEQMVARIAELEQQKALLGNALQGGAYDVKDLCARIAELEKRSHMVVPNPISMMVESWANPQKEWDAANGKTPGQVNYAAFRDGVMNHHEMDTVDKWEAAANAVLRAFGQPRQTTQDAAEALRRVRDRVSNEIHYEHKCLILDIVDDELAKLEAKPAGKAPECFLCGKGPHDHTMMVLESLPEQFEVKWCNGRRQNFGTEKPAWWDVPKSDHVHELGSCSFCDKSPPDTSMESGLPDPVLASITLPTKPTKPLRDAIAPRDIIVIVEEPPIECDECGQTNGSHALWCGT